MPPRKLRTLSRSRSGCRPSLRPPTVSGSRTMVSNTRALSASSSEVPTRPRMRPSDQIEDALGHIETDGENDEADQGRHAAARQHPVIDPPA